MPIWGLIVVREYEVEHGAGFNYINLANFRRMT